MPDDPVHTPPTALSTADGCTLDVAWAVPDGDVRATAVLTHPHPRFGGDMHNVVPAGLARTLPDAGIACLRFDFRGVGASTGSHGDGIAEVADVVAAVDAAHAWRPDVPVVVVGYSFGADVALAVDHPAVVGLVAVAPPLAVLPLDDLARPRSERLPTLLLSPEHDQFRSPGDAATVTATWPGTSCAVVEGRDHFLAASTPVLTDAVVDFVDRLLTGR